MWNLISTPNSLIALISDCGSGYENFASRVILVILVSAHTDVLRPSLEACSFYLQTLGGSVTPMALKCLRPVCTNSWSALTTLLCEVVCAPDLWPWADPFCWPSVLRWSVLFTRWKSSLEAWGSGNQGHQAYANVNILQPSNYWHRYSFTFWFVISRV